MTEAGPRSDIELVRRATAALVRGDFDATLAEWAPDAVLDWSRSLGFEARVYRGHREIGEFLKRFREAFGDMRLELFDPVEVRPGVLVVENVVHVRGRDGIEAHARSTWLITVSEGLQTSLTLYQTKEEALEAAASMG